VLPHRQKGIPATAADQHPATAGDNAASTASAVDAVTPAHLHGPDGRPIKRCARAQRPPALRLLEQVEQPGLLFLRRG
jgi:hypothetical protein